MPILQETWKNIKPISKEEPKRTNKFLEKNRIENEKPLKSIAFQSKFSSGFAEKMKQMNDLFKTQSQQDHLRRGKSVRISSTKLGFGQGKSDWKDNGPNNLELMDESKNINEFNLSNETTLFLLDVVFIINLSFSSNKSFIDFL